jgi:uncharacterized protein with GYD domain
MPTYICLANYTDQGMRNVKDSPKRLNALKDIVAELGGQLTSFHLCMGTYDGVLIMDFPDDEAAAKFALAVGAGGNARTTTLKAFSEANYQKIIADLP